MAHGKNLCLSCSHFSAIKVGTTDLLRCRIFGKINGVASECNRWTPRDSISIDDMYTMAWIMTKEKKIGFETIEFVFKKPDNFPRVPQANGPIA